MDKEKRKYYKDKYQKAFLEVRQVINDIDPMGLIEMCGPEEYDMEVADILAKIQNCNSEDEIRKMVIDVFTHYFDDAGDVERYPNVGHNLIAVKSIMTTNQHL